MDPFLFKMTVERASAPLLVLLSLVSIVINAALWVGFAFLLAYAATKGYAAAV